jgi:hypothetical protein
MKGTVVRTGQHSGGDHFVEIQETPSSPPYAVPVDADLPLGTVLEITVKVVEEAPTPTGSIVGQDVSVSDKTPLVVEESPLADETDTAPSGQEEPTKKAKEKK